MTPYNILKDKNALVTGSTSGIGLAIGKVLAAYGCNVTLSGSRDASRVEDLLKDLTQSYPNQKFHYFQVDLSDIDNVKPFYDKVLEANQSGVHILVNNAGVQHVSPIHSFPQEQWTRLMNINLNSCFLLMKEFISYWKSKKEKTGMTPWGRIVNISSVHGLVASVNKSAYVASKFALNGLTKVAALEMAADMDITVNAVCPGFVYTPLVEKQIEKMKEERGLTFEEATEELVGEKQPTKKFSSAEDIGEYCAFLCSSAAANITGATQVIDGAWTVG